VVFPGLSLGRLNGWPLSCAPIEDCVPTALYPLHQSLDSRRTKRIEWRIMSDEGRPACEIHKDGNGDVFVLVGGRKIAKRGLPDTPQADTWIMLGMVRARRQGWEGNRGQVRARSDALTPQMTTWVLCLMPGGDDGLESWRDTRYL
jgi:hypothetical protein